MGSRDSTGGSSSSRGSSETSTLVSASPPASQTSTHFRGCPPSSLPLPDNLLPLPPRPSQLEQLSALRKRRQCKQKHHDGAAVRGGGHEPKGESELRSGQVSSRVQRARLHT